MDVVFAVVLLCMAIYAYFLPTVVAYNRKQPNLTAIGVLNVFLGWTFVGWVVALVWAMSKPAVITVVVPPESK